VSTFLTPEPLQPTASECTLESKGEHPLEQIINADFPCSIVSPENLSQLKVALAAYATAEQHIKSAELSGNDVDIPSINELRYFGYHICKAFACDASDGGKALQLDELKKAHKHCKRASYDAIELGLVEALESISDFNDQFKGRVVISEVISDYAEKKAKVKKIQELMNSNKNADRDEYYVESLQHMKDLKNIAAYLDECTDDLTHKITENNNKEVKANRTFYTGLVMIFIATLTLGVQWYRASKIPTPARTDDTATSTNEKSTVIESKESHKAE